MRVLQINIFGNLSTGKIAVDIYHMLKRMVMKDYLHFLETKRHKMFFTINLEIDIQYYR